MTPAPYPAVNFAAAPCAWAKIARIRACWNRRFADEADAPMIGWGTPRLHDGTSRDHVVVGFYGRSERPGIAHGVQRVGDREVVFFVLPEDHGRFAGMTGRHAPDRGFFLSPM